MMTDSENEKNKQHLRGLLHTGIRIEELYPQVEKIEMHHVREYNSFVGPKTTEGTWTITPNSEVYFVLDCLNRECTASGFNLKSIISGAIHNYETEISGEVRCDGQEAPDHPEQSCSGSLKYTIKITYRQETLKNQ